MSPLTLTDDIEQLSILKNPKAVWSQPQCSQLRRRAWHTRPQRGPGTLGTRWCVPALFRKLCSWPDSELRDDSGTVLCSNKVFMSILGGPVLQSTPEAGQSNRIYRWRREHKFAVFASRNGLVSPPATGLQRFSFRRADFNDSPWNSSRSFSPNVLCSCSCACIKHSSLSISRTHRASAVLPISYSSHAVLISLPRVRLQGFDKLSMYRMPKSSSLNLCSIIY